MKQHIHSACSMRNIFLVGFFLITCSTIYAQGVFVPLHSNVYEYLDRMSIKGVTEYSKFVLPKTRTEIATNLQEIEMNAAKLTRLEKEELQWFKREYFDELSGSSLPPNSETIQPRWRLYSYADSVFTFYLSPILGFTAASRFDETQLHRWNGISLSSSLADHWGFRMDFRDNWEKGKRLDEKRMTSIETGFGNIFRGTNSIEYDNVQASVTFESKFVSVSLAKEWMNWGSGYRSQMILSSKAPSFPVLRLDVRPVEWLRFYYVHGFLNSEIVDSTQGYFINYSLSDTVGRYRRLDVEKFYAAHVVEILPHKNLRIALGESIVYSDQGPLAGFLIPVIFFRLADHYYNGFDGNKGGNSQMFLDVNARLWNRYNVYGTLFIDELSITNLLDGNTDRNQFGFTVGGAAYGLLPNLLLRGEYTRILPWVYINRYPAQWYTNVGYNLGHYIGQNADQLYAQADYRIIRGLEVKLWAELIRRGALADIREQNREPGEVFLYPPLRTDRTIGIEAHYEIFHELFVKGFFRYSSVSDDCTCRTADYELGKKQSVGLSLYYGL